MKIKEGSLRINRGGSWNDHAVFCEASLRGSHFPSIRDYILGLRVARRKYENK